MLSNDYDPNHASVLPSSDSVTLTTSGAADYGTVAPTPAAPGTDSAKVTENNKFSRIGHDVTDGPAVVSVLEAEGKA